MSKRTTDSGKCSSIQVAKSTDCSKNPLQEKSLLCQQPPIFNCSNPPHPQIKNIIAIGSGKGGVGKSTLTYLIAHAFAKMGNQVGILDADIYGPSQPLLHQTSERPPLHEGMISPLFIQNIQLMSIGLINRKDSALSWRGPMIAKALLQMFMQTQWNQLDYLFIDLPPGTGDIPMSLCQKLPTTAYVSVTHPHPLSISTNDRFEMLMDKLKVPKLLCIYNQSDLKAPNHLPTKTEYQHLSPLIDEHIMALAEQIAVNLYQQATYQPNT
ncbi:Mrp/NBP35 family ATP-binding protein [Gammaproteobacteria bacterium]|nr:Mrp/NBP35 family ATP-binding protein [Gammaproteobacteria bacterium]